MMDIDWEIEPTNAHEEILWSDLIVVVMFWVRCSVSVYYFSSLVVFFSIFVWFYASTIVRFMVVPGVLRQKSNFCGVALAT